MDSSSISFQKTIPPFEKDFIEEYIPHKLKLEECENDKSFFINSSINCLTNNKSFIQYLYHYASLNPSEYFSIFKETITGIFDYIKENQNQKDRMKNYTLEDFNNLILKKIKLFEYKLNRDPRVLIDCIFNLILNVNTKDNLNTSSLNFLNIDENTSNQFEKSFMEDNKKESNAPGEEKLNITIEKSNICPNCGNNNILYKFFPTFHLDLEDNSETEYTISKCINNYFEKENEESEYICSKCSKIFKNKSKSKFQKLPNDLIFFLYYKKKNGNDNNSSEFYYKFEQTLDFTNNEFFDNQNIENKKFYLSSIILCKSPKTKEEFFYTLCRKGHDSDFLIYKTKDKGVYRHGKIINRQVNRLKNENNKDLSFPYVLIYSKLEK